MLIIMTFRPTDLEFGLSYSIGVLDIFKQLNKFRKTIGKGQAIKI